MQTAVWKNYSGLVVVVAAYFWRSSSHFKLDERRQKVWNFELNPYKVIFDIEEESLKRLN